MQTRNVNLTGHSDAKKLLVSLFLTPRGELPFYPDVHITQSGKLLGLS
jgi:hypothetical protein